MNIINMLKETVSYNISQLPPMNMWHLFECFTALIQIITLSMFLKGFLGQENKSYIKNAISIILMATLLFIVNTIIQNQLVTAATVIICIFAQAFILFDSDRKTKIAAVGLIMGFIVGSEVLALSFVMALNKITANAATIEGVYRLAGSVMSTVILFAVTRIVVTYRKRKNIDMPVLYWIAFLVVIIINIFLTYTVYINVNTSITEGSVAFVIVSAIGLLFGIIMFFLFETVLRETSLKSENKLWEKQVKYQLDHYKTLEINQEENRKARHDFGNHLISIKGMLNTNKLDKAVEYIDNIENLSFYSENFISTGNPVIDSIFSVKFLLAENMGITVNHTIQIPADIKIKPIDACAIFGNSLDNAIEGCNRVENGKKAINIALMFNDGNLIYKITNTTDGKLIKDGDFYKSTKESDTTQHGMGLKNIKDAVSKYNGTFGFNHENNTFELHFMIYNIQKF